jgi:hypothetical protein
MDSDEESFGRHLWTSVPSDQPARGCFLVHSNREVPVDAEIVSELLSTTLVGADEGEAKGAGLLVSPSLKQVLPEGPRVVRVGPLVG